MKHLLLPLLAVAALLMPGALPSPPAATAQVQAAAATAMPLAPATTPTAAQVTQKLDSMPLRFEGPNKRSAVPYDFLAHGPGYTAFLTPTAAVLVFDLPDKPSGQAGPAAQPTPSGTLPSTPGKPPFLAGKFGPRGQPAPSPATRWAVWMTLVGASDQARATGEDLLPGTANYFIGKDPAKWRTNLSTYARVVYRQAYPGIDVAYYGDRDQLEDDFDLAPGADPSRIVLHVAGADKLSVDGDGMLVARLGQTDVHWRKPNAFQTVSGVQRDVAVAYRLDDRGDVHLSLGAYDRTRPLVIDPELGYSTYLGGSYGSNGTSIAVDASGNAYVTGWNDSPDFPVTPGAFQTVCADYNYQMDNPCDDAFIAKLDANGSTLLYSTYLGGNYYDGGAGIAVDRYGNAYVAGATKSTNFPTTQGVFQPICSTYESGNSHVFVAKINDAGSSLVYSTCIAGSNEEFPTGISLDSNGDAYITGITHSTNFPVTPGAYQTVPANDIGTLFVTKLNVTGSALAYSTFLGGSGSDTANGLALDAAGDAYITGYTSSLDFPVTPGAFQTAPKSYNDEAFVTKLNPQGSELVYSTYLGGSGDDVAQAITVDASGDAYVAGRTSSDDFPVTPAAFQATCNSCFPGYYDVFVAKFNASGSALLYSTYLGGSSWDDGYGIALDASGDAYVSGVTYSIDFPTTPDALQSSCVVGTVCSSGDAFFTEINGTGTALLYSTILGGSYSDWSSSIAVDLDGNAYITGGTFSSDFPLSPCAFQTSLLNGGASPAFVTKLLMGTAISLSNCSGPTGTVLEVKGSSFAVSSVVTLTGGGVAVLGTVTADSRGDFAVNVRIPTAATAGAYTVGAVDGAGNSASANFTVGSPSAVLMAFPLPPDPTDDPTGTGEGLIGAFFDHQYPLGTVEPPGAEQTLLPFTGVPAAGTRYACTLGVSCFSGHDGIDYAFIGGLINQYSMLSEYDGRVPVFAAAPGTASVSTDSCGVPVVSIQHNSYYESIYEHLTADQFLVKQGADVSAGTVIGTLYPGPSPVGPFGQCSTGTDLHFGVYHDPTGQASFTTSTLVDPYGFPTDETDPWATTFTGADGTTYHGGTSTWLWAFSPAGHVPTSPGQIETLTTSGAAASIPGRALAVFATLSLVLVPDPSSGAPTSGAPVTAATNHTYALSAIGGNGTPITPFLTAVSLTMAYTPADVADINPATLAIYEWNATSGTWQALPTTVDATDGQATASVPAAGIVSLRGQPLNAAPVATTVSPSSGTNSGTTPISIYGTGFTSATSANLGLGALQVTFVSPTQLTAQVPTGYSPGPYTLTLRNADGQTTFLPNAFTVTGLYRGPAPQAAPAPTATRAHVPQVTPQPTPSGRVPAPQVTPQTPPYS